MTFSLTDPASFPAALDGVSAVFLMRPSQITRASAFAPFLAALKANRIDRVVALSVKGAENNRLLPHHGMEMAIKQGGFAWTMIRPSDFMQNLETVHREEIRDRSEIAVPAGQGRSAFIDVDDIGEVIAKVMTQAGPEGRGYTLTGPEALSFTDVAATLSAVLGRRITYHPLGIARFVLEQHRRGQVLGLSLVMTMLYTVQRMGGADGVTGDLQALLGRPAGPLSAYVERHRALWQPAPADLATI